MVNGAPPSETPSQLRRRWLPEDRGDVGRGALEALEGAGLVSSKTGKGTSEVRGVQEGVGVRLGVLHVPRRKEHAL